MIEQLNTTIDRIQGLSDLVSMQTKGRWDSWFKVNNNRAEIQAKCSQVITELRHVQLELMKQQAAQGRSLTREEKGGTT